MFFASLPPRSSDVIGFLELWALALHVTALVKLMMNQLFVQGLRDVSLSSCLITGQYQSLRRITVECGLAGDTYGNCAERSCFVSVDAQPDLISWSNLRLGWHWR